LEKAELVKSGQLSHEEYMKFVNAVVAEEAKKL
jgi:polyhydroxyalkanoate synthesis regulator phasin